MLCQNYAEFRQLALGNQPGTIGRPSKKRLNFEQMLMKRRRIFSAIAKREIPKVCAFPVVFLSYMTIDLQLVVFYDHMKSTILWCFRHTK